MAFERKGCNMYKLWETLEEAKKLKWVELSHSLNNDSPYWSETEMGGAVPQP